MDRQTGVRIVRASRAGDVITTEVRLEEGEWPSAPVAPASVWTDDHSRVIELHRQVDLTDDVAIFETYGIDGETPDPGGLYALYAWWSPEQLKAAEDRNLAWTLQSYDRPGDHDHCLFTWATIGPGDVAYHSDDGWVSVDAYDRFIRDDALRLRSHEEQ
jgi:hypothetical protein